MLVPQSPGPANPVHGVVRPELFPRNLQPEVPEVSTCGDRQGAATQSTAFLRRHVAMALWHETPPANRRAQVQRSANACRTFMQAARHRSRSGSRRAVRIRLASLLLFPQWFVLLHLDSSASLATSLHEFRSINVTLGHSFCRSITLHRCRTPSFSSRQLKLNIYKCAKIYISDLVISGPDETSFLDSRSFQW